MHGYYRFAAVSPELKLANPRENAAALAKAAREASEAGCAAVVFPELCLTGYSCGDLFFRKDLQEAALKGLIDFAEATAGLPIVSVVGLPYKIGNALYNVAAVTAGGCVWGLVPKTFLPAYHEYYEQRQFTPATALPAGTRVAMAGAAEDGAAPAGNDLIFDTGEFRFSVDVCEDMWMPHPPGADLARSGVDAVFNLSASTDYLSKAAQRRGCAAAQSAARMCAYVLASAGPGESTADAVYGGHVMVAAGGAVLKEGELFLDGGARVAADVDLEALAYRRLATTSLNEGVGAAPAPMRVVQVRACGGLPGSFPEEVRPAPFFDEFAEDGWARKLVEIQATALARRMRAARTDNLVIGVSGGADSALALIGARAAVKRLGRGKVVAVVMPGPGSGEESQRRAAALAEGLGAEVRVINIVEQCRLKLKAIGHDGEKCDITFENVQARERTEILMNLANLENALVVGTGDLSEIALGWNTYNGDHMSMYQINASVPKTMVLAALRELAKDFAGGAAEGLLLEVSEAPITPELVPGAAANDSEDRLGPYAVHDFCLYHFVANGAGEEKLADMAAAAFRGTYGEEVARKTCATFLRRFWAAQYKRECVPNGPKITISLSPRADWRMPPDAARG